MLRGGWIAIAFTIPGAVFWGPLCALLAAVVPSIAAAVLMLGYALIYGLAETYRFPLRPPGTGWQVPKEWIARGPYAVRALAWGLTLGPGVMTRNPLAGMWLFPALAILAAEPLAAGLAGAAAGALHGAGRAAGVLRQIRAFRRAPAGDPRAYYDSVLRTMRWQSMDGMLLLAMAGALALYAGFGG